MIKRYNIEKTGDLIYPFNVNLDVNGEYVKYDDVVEYIEQHTKQEHISEVGKKVCKCKIEQLSNLENKIRRILFSTMY